MSATARVDRRQIIAVASTSIGAAGMAGAVPVEAAATPSGPVRHGYVRVGPANVFYREAGSPSSPTILLLHGFANSSHYFRHLMPALATRYRVIAPDMHRVALPRGLEPLFSP